MSNESTSITVRVPASTSNLGSGFDTLGIALNLHNFVKVTRSANRGATITSPIPDDARAGATAMIDETATRFFTAAGKKAFGFEVELSGDVPIARGLGSSVTVRLGVTLALNAFCGEPLGNQEILNLVTALEHHPDNAAPALFGGFAVAGMVGVEVRCLSVKVNPFIKFITMIPTFEVSTEKARTLVPDSFSKTDTIHILNRAAMVAAAFARGDVECLRGFFDDRIHQPYRSKLIPALPKVIEAGVKAGAIGGWLSGSGSTIICLATDNQNPDAIAEAMEKEIPGSAMHVLTADPTGARIVS